MSDSTLREIAEFLDGSAPLEGVWFGEPHPTERGAFWWRSRLTAALAADDAARGTMQEADCIVELNHAQWLALENVRLFAARHRKEEWAQHMLRFVEEAGTNKAQITRRQVEQASRAAAPQAEPCNLPLIGGELPSLTDRLWNSAGVMSLNAELGLTMEQLVRLALAVQPLLPAPPTKKEQP